MKTQDIKKLSRSELVDIIYQLQRKEQEQQEKIRELEIKLEDRRLKIENSGSLAEASLALKDVFETAQKAADIYLEEIRKRSENIDEECERRIQEAQHKADWILEDAISRRDAMEKEIRATRMEIKKLRRDQ